MISECRMGRDPPPPPLRGSKKGYSIILSSNNNNNKKKKKKSNGDHYLTCRLPPQVKRNYNFLEIKECFLWSSYFGHDSGHVHVHPYDVTRAAAAPMAEGEGRQHVHVVHQHPPPPVSPGGGIEIHAITGGISKKLRSFVFFSCC